MKQSTMKKWRLLGIVLVAFIVGVVGCPETQQMMKPVVDEVMDDKSAKPPAMVGDMKKPEEKPATETEPEVAEEEPEPEKPADTTPPTVVEVAWYADQQLTEVLTTDSEVQSGDTVYTVVRFSEPMMHIVAGDETVRPVLYIVIDGKTRRYKMLPHEADLQSGEAKPLQDDTDYLCKYTIPADIVGTFALRVGSATVDIAGNKVAEASVHTTPFMVTEPEPEQTIPLPPGYTLPQELVPETVTLSQNERTLSNIILRYEEVNENWDTFAPPRYFTTDKQADVISVLPYEYREEVYELFAASVDLPYFAEAAEVMKEVNIKLMTLADEARSTGDWTPYDTYLFDTAHKRRGLYVGGVIPELLRDIYFEENPHLLFQAGVSRYWFILEWYRIQLEHANLNVNKILQRYDLLDLYRESCRNGNIFGFDNPWD